MKILPSRKKASITIGALVTTIVTVIYYLFGGGTIIIDEPIIGAESTVSVDNKLDSIKPIKDK